MRVTNNTNRSWVQLWAGAVLVVGLCSCAAPNGGVGARFESTDGLARRIPLLGDPRALRSDFASPPMSTRSRFSWRSGWAEWRILMGEAEGGQAGFALIRPVDLTGADERMSLTFKMKPASLADNLRVALFRDEGDGPVVLGDSPLLAHQVGRTRQNWTVFSIPLSDFTPVTDSAQETDWSAIRGVQFSAANLDDGPASVLIRNLEFRRAGFLP